MGNDKTRLRELAEAYGQAALEYEHSLYGSSFAASYLAMERRAEAGRAYLNALRDDAVSRGDTEAIAAIDARGDA
jgi:hypothetical protein